MLIEKTRLRTDTLSGKAVLVTGAGGGIGFETARALAWLGVDVIIAEIDEEKGAYARDAINKELCSSKACFYAVDLSDEAQIDGLCDFIDSRYGHLDVLINNATVATMGAVDAVPVTDWDYSYAVNLRAPVLLTQKFLPGMKARNSGVIVFVQSSGAAPYMGAYEVFKTAQAELCSTLAGELEGTGVCAYAIAPGLVRTETAQRAIETVSLLMGMTAAEFYKMNENHMMSAEEAGVGFAVSVVNAGRYSGLEIGCVQALMDAGVLDAGVFKNEKLAQAGSLGITPDGADGIEGCIEKVVRAFNEQYDGWHERSVFERQWVLRDFKKTVGMAADGYQNLLASLLELAKEKNYEKIAGHKAELEKLIEFYDHQYKLLQGYEKDPVMLEGNSRIIRGWIGDVQAVLDYFR
ncbi:MAG: SDR family oxidoreductase [Clostridiales bacterium]|nr:SDR family oxidoreductase [Clostridiales bacterium]